jgi:O-antigen ligase
MYKILLFLVLYLPFQLALNPAQDVDLASIRVLILALFFLWLAQGLKNRKIGIGADLQTFLVGSFLFLSFFSIVSAQNTDWSVRKLLFLFSIFPIYFVAGQLVKDRKGFIEMIKAAIFSGALVAMLGVVQFFSQFFFGFKTVYVFWAKSVIIPFLGTSFGEAVLKNPSWLVNISGKTYLRATSLFPDPHMFSFYLGLVLPLAGGMIFYAEKRKILYVVAFLAIFLADVLTFSRGGYVGLFAGLVFSGIFFWDKIQKKSKIAASLVMAAAILVMTVPSPVSQRFLSSFNAKEGSNQGRLEMWKKASEAIMDHPLSGIGIGNYPLEVSATATYRDPIYAHNTYLDIAAETGLMNAACWIALLMATMFSFWTKAKKEPLFFFALISVVIFAAHSLFETAIYSPVVLTLFLIIISFSQLEINDGKNI